MNLLNFTTTFPDEQSCKLKWKEFREKEGVVCPHCGSKEHYWKSDKECYECKKCKYRQSLRSNTIMHLSKQPFRYWFVAFHLLTSTKKSFSAKELQRQLGHKNYEAIWALLHKLRMAMGKRDDQYTLSGILELDEGFFSTEMNEEDKRKPLKRGRGSQKKSKVLVMAESAPVEKENQKGRPSRKVNHIKMLVIEDLKSETIDNKIRETVSATSEIDSDNSTSYTNLKNLVAQHHPQVIPKEDISKILPWVHITISNAKRMLLNTFHDVKPEYLQSYLNEFCYKFTELLILVLFI
ncbi:hypothetical protein EZS27_013456 [termite gut metagenome]|uniref:ISXO2-like transposase domain-containing protein n=2 Tax=termite gut metagenome TaxID=433724 RepID=A0A5J4RZU4_9ZZZZ